jgi:hypothetical protein
MWRQAAQSRKEKVQAYSSREVYGKTALDARTLSYRHPGWPRFECLLTKS